MFSLHCAIRRLNGLPGYLRLCHTPRAPGYGTEERARATAFQEHLMPLASDYLRNLADEIEDSDNAIIVITVDGNDAEMFTNTTESDAEGIMRELLERDMPSVH